MATNSRILPEKFHEQKSLAGYSLWGPQKVRHDIVTEQQQLRKLRPTLPFRASGWRLGLALLWMFECLWFYLMYPEAVHFHLWHSSRHLCILKLATVHCLLDTSTLCLTPLSREAIQRLAGVKPHGNLKEKRFLCFSLITILLEIWALRLGLLSSQRPVFISNRSFGWNMHGMPLGSRG